MTPEELQKKEAKQVKRWLDDMPDAMRVGLEDASKRLTNELLDATSLVDIQRLQADIRALRVFTNKLAFYASIEG